jgi:hypothetical protein
MNESPIKYLLQNRVQVLSAFTGSPVEAWKRLVADIQIDAAMKENTFRTIIKPFVEVHQYFEAGLNNQLNNEIDRLNTELNTFRESRLNKTQGGLNNMETEQGLNKKLNIDGWTVAKSGRYFRAFRKIRGKVQGIHLGLTLDGAAEKIKAKSEQITRQQPD